MKRNSIKTLVERMAVRDIAQYVETKRGEKYLQRKRRIKMVGLYTIFQKNTMLVSLRICTEECLIIKMKADQ